MVYDLIMFSFDGPYGNIRFPEYFVFLEANRVLNRLVVYDLLIGSV